MNKNELIRLVKKLLRTEIELEFLAKLEPGELEVLVACIRHRLVQVEE